MKKVYLAGAIFGQSNAVCYDWRKHVTEKLSEWGAEALDPMRRDFRGKEAESRDEIIRLDLIDIATCDVVFAFASVPSWGTAMELVYARVLHKPVIIWGVPEKFSPWLEFHCDVYTHTLDQGLAELMLALEYRQNADIL